MHGSMNVKSSPISVTSLFILFYLCLGLSDYPLSLGFPPTVLHKCLPRMLYASIYVTRGQQVSSNCYNHIPDYTA